MRISETLRQWTIGGVAGVALLHAASGLAGTNSVDLYTTLEQAIGGPVTAGESFQLDWVIANNAENVSSQAIGRLPVDASAEFIEASCPSTFEAGVLLWTPPSVDAAAPRSCVVSLRSANPGILQFSAIVETSNGDSDFDESNNAALLLVDVEQGTNAVDLAVRLAQVIEGPVVAGADFDLRWLIANDLAGSVSSSAESRLQLPQQVQFLGTSCPSVFDSGVVTWTPPSVDNVAPRQCVVTLRSVAAAHLDFETDVQASAQDSDNNLANNSASLRVSIQGGAVVAQELPTFGWPAVLAMMGGLIACAAVVRRRLDLIARGV
jgi:hypothetical protein